MVRVKKLRASSDCWTRAARAAVIGVLLAGTGAAVVAPAGASAEPRPWLCRDKPVFSSDGPTRYEIRGRDRRHWQVFFMQFVPGGAHDGFAIAASDDLGAGSSETQGQLAAGRFFAVALYLGAGGHWLCPRSAQELGSEGGPGVVTELCYGDDESNPCRIRLTVKRAERKSMTTPERLP